jgi:hypothetical protein
MTIDRPLSTHEKFVDDARQLLRTRHPLESRRDDHWSPLDDCAVARLLYSLPESRAIDIASGIGLPDGRIVRFAITRDAKFDQVKLLRGTFGQVDGATGYCRSCRAYRMLDVSLFPGGRALTCPGCRSWEVEEEIRGVPL